MPAGIERTLVLSLGTCLAPSEQGLNPLATTRGRNRVTGFWITLATVAAYGGLHSLMASNRAKEGIRRIFGTVADRWYRLVFNLLAGLLFLPVLAVAALYPGMVIYRLNMPWLVIAVGVQLLALIALAVGLLQTDALHFLGLRQLSQPDTDAPPRLVVSGMYRWVRHPLYTAGLAFIWFTPWMSTSLLALNIGLTAYILVGSEFEERRLLSVFGETYADYQRRVPRIIPRPWRTSRASPQH
jgi:protein-S-isoprenylcysteine O-methyltransferase Ste14